MERTLWTVTNIGEDERSFVDRHSGRVILLKGKESVVTTAPPEENEYFKIEKASEEKSGKRIKKQKYNEEDE